MRRRRQKRIWFILKTARIEQPPVKEEFELREKRLKPTCKILYVAAALWAAAFLTYTAGFSKNPDQFRQMAPFYCFLFSLSSVVMLSIASYVFKELRCFKISQKCTGEEGEAADAAFIHIGSSLAPTVFLAIVLTAGHLLLTPIDIRVFAGVLFFVYAFFKIGGFIVRLVRKKKPGKKPTTIPTFMNVIANIVGSYCFYAVLLTAV